MEDVYEGYWYRSHEDSKSFRQCGLYKENKDHPNHVFDDDVTDVSLVDDRVADAENEELLNGKQISMGIQEFLEVGMKYRITIEVKEGKYLLQIENI